MGESEREKLAVLEWGASGFYPQSVAICHYWAGDFREDLPADDLVLVAKMKELLLGK